MMPGVRRVFRRLLILCSTASLLLCVTGVALWCFSYATPRVGPSRLVRSWTRGPR